MNDKDHGGQRGSTKILRTALYGVVSCGLGLLLNLLSVVTSNSLVLIADLFNSALQFVSILLSYLALRVLEKESRAFFNYGLGKLENIASLFIGLFMSLSTLVMVFLIVNRLRNLVPIGGAGVWLGVACTLFFGSINARLLAQSLRQNRETPSPIVEAQGKLFAVKALSNACMFLTFTLSLSLTSEWVKYLDPLASIVTTWFMVASTWKLVRSSVHDLLDRSLDEPMQLIITRHLAGHFEAYDSLGEVRSRYSGRDIYVDIFLGFAPDRILGDVQKTVDSLAEAIRREIPNSRVTVIPYASAGSRPSINGLVYQ